MTSHHGVISIWWRLTNDMTPICLPRAFRMGPPESPAQLHARNGLAIAKELHNKPFCVTHASTPDARAQNITSGLISVTFSNILEHSSVSVYRTRPSRKTFECWPPSDVSPKPTIFSGAPTLGVADKPRGTNGLSTFVRDD